MAERVSSKDLRKVLEMVHLAHQDSHDELPELVLAELVALVGCESVSTLVWIGSRMGWWP